ncbi:hypothetical protein PRUPE_2G038000 [Prunus persica]|uniref:NAD(P)H dehydrogenase (quinone) n=1 Tax=Prunus persica TaxID=3760 RepID=M5X5F6_PRUPE|nr:NADPH:quinone oxidoreductase [Prunus persica]ONI20870.1 hypothetical protein PRUPE_2G038000 [Prunus persica]
MEEEDSSVAAKSVVKVEVGLGQLCRCFCLFGTRAAPITNKSKNINKNSVIKVAAVCGSLREASYNRCLIRSAIEISKTSIDGLEIEYVDISALPFLNVDLEGKDGSFPPAVEAFRRKILEADSILFASPEYNYSISAPLKNAIDWASRPPNAWADKAAAVVSASGDFGGGRSQYHLRQVGVSLDLHFINKPEFFLDGLKSPEKFDSRNLVDEQDKERLKEILLALQAFTLRLQTK